LLENPVLIFKRTGILVPSVLFGGAILFIKGTSM